jgi:hypothetical protein
MKRAFAGQADAAQQIAARHRGQAQSQERVPRNLARDDHGLLGMISSRAKLIIPMA